MSFVEDFSNYTLSISFQIINTHDLGELLHNVAFSEKHRQHLHQQPVLHWAGDFPRSRKTGWLWEVML